MKKQPGYFIVVLLLLTALLGACGDNTATPATTAPTTGPTQSSTTAAASAASVTIVSGTDFWPAVQKYNKDLPDLKINTVTSPWGNGGRDMKNKELIMMSGGDYPDLAQMVWLKEFAKAGLLLDITDQVKNWDVYKNLTKGQLDRMSYNGRIYGLTMGNNTIFEYYNKDILAKVGMTGPIKTLDELQTLAQKIKDANAKAANGNPIYTTAFDGGNWATDYWLWANGGKQMNDDYTKTLIDSPESIKAYSNMQNLVKSGAAPKPDGNSNQLWLNGQLAVYFSGAWDAKGTVDAKVNYGVATMPTGSASLSTTSVGGVEYAIFKNSKNQKEALSLLKAAASDAYQTNTDTNAMAYFTNLAAYDDPGKQAAWKAQGVGILESQLATRDQLKNSTYNFLEAPFVFPDASTIYNDALAKILVKGDDPASVMKDAATQINQGISDALANK